jgi:pilus assembly protein Flp/PilA
MAFDYHPGRVRLIERSHHATVDRYKEKTVMNASIRTFLKEEDGVTALEYGLLAAMVAGALVAFAGPQIRTFFETLFTALTEHLGTALGSTE